MGLNNILLDSITTPWDIILASIKSAKSNSSKSVSVSSKSDKFHIPKIEDYISKKYEVALQH